MRHTVANVLRNLAVIATLAAERLDPQPDVTVHPFNIHGANGTTGCEAHITWHTSGYKETC